MKSKGAPGRAAAVAYLSKDPEPYAILLDESHKYVRDMAAVAMIRIESRDGLAGAPSEGLPQVTTKKQ